MRASMSVMPHYSRSVSVGHIDRKMRASVSIIDRKAPASMLIVERERICRSLNNSRLDRASAFVIIGHRASAGSIVKRARQYRSSGISHRCTFVF
jgi:hypothetical protein